VNPPQVDRSKKQNVLPHKQSTSNVVRPVKPKVNNPMNNFKVVTRYGEFEARQCTQDTCIIVRFDANHSCNVFADVKAGQWIVTNGKLAVILDDDQFQLLFKIECEA
jgi:hypothetical protein